MKLINDKVYLYFDKKAKNCVDSFISPNKEVALRFATVRIQDAIRAKNLALLTFWRDCEIYEIDFAKDEINAELVVGLETLIPDINKLLDSFKDEKN